MEIISSSGLTGLNEMMHVKHSIMLATGQVFNCACGLGQIRQHSLELQLVRQTFTASSTWSLCVQGHICFSLGKGEGPRRHKAGYGGEGAAECHTVLTQRLFGQGC